MFYTKRRHFIHCLLKKKSSKRCRFDGTVYRLLPLDALQEGEKGFFFSPYNVSLSLPLAQKTPTQPTPMAYH
jgi:hypothetical protein